MSTTPVVSALEASSSPPRIADPLLPSGRTHRQFAAHRRRITHTQLTVEDQIDATFANYQGWRIPKTVPAYPCAIIYSDTGVPQQEIEPIAQNNLSKALKETLKIAKLPHETDNAGKSTYALVMKPSLSRIARSEALRQLSIAKSTNDREQIVRIKDKLEPFDEYTGTCVHHGAGVFSTALHVFGIHLPDSCTLDDIRLTIQAVWGAGSLLELGILSRHRSFELQILAMPDAVVGHWRRDPKFLFANGLDSSISISPQDDMAFLCLKAGSNHEKFKFHRRVLPALQQSLLDAVDQSAANFPVRLFAVNGLYSAEKYYEQYISGAVMDPRPSKAKIKKVLKSMNLGKISMSVGTAAHTPRMVPQVGPDTNYDYLLRHTSACISGSSGGALMNDDYQHIAIHIMSEVGAICGMRWESEALKMTQEHRSVAVLWSAPSAQQLISDHVLPYLRNAADQDLEVIEAFQKIVL